MRAAVVMVVASLAFGAAASGDRHWTYSGHGGPAEWGGLAPEFAVCATGGMQSPIDIVGAQRERLPALQFAYRDAPLRLVNNGHAIQVNLDEGGALTVGERRYRLLQFHFHTPSEERVGGRRFAMVAHLVHRDEAGRLGVVAVLFEPGQENAALAAIWANLPERPGPETAVPGAAVNPARLLPADVRYYTFAGSLTTPPCAEGVTWYVLKTPVELSDAQLRRMTRIFPDNARPVQPLNGRVVLEAH